MPKLDEQISTLQERLKQLKLRQQRSEARKKAVEAQREKRAETRRQFVAGALILAKVRDGSLPESQFRGWLDEALTRPEDRALFDLPPKQKGEPMGAEISVPAEPSAEMSPSAEPAPSAEMQAPA